MDDTSLVAQRSTDSNPVDRKGGRGRESATWEGLGCRACACVSGFFYYIFFFAIFSFLHSFSFFILYSLLEDCGDIHFAPTI